MGRQRTLIPGLILLVLGTLTLGCADPPPYIPPEILANPPDLLSDHVSPLPLGESFDGNDWIQSTLFGAPNRSDPRLPNYSYFQGLLQAKEHILVTGQVRIVGGVLGADNGVGAFYAGAMATTNPYAYTAAGPLLTGGPNGIRTRVGHWEEIPNP
jgi:hypothetical protein